MCTANRSQTSGVASLCAPAVGLRAGRQAERARPRRQARGARQRALIYYRAQFLNTNGRKTVVLRLTLYRRREAAFERARSSAGLVRVFEVPPDV